MSTILHADKKCTFPLLVLRRTSQPLAWGHACDNKHDDVLALDIRSEIGKRKQIAFKRVPTTRHRNVDCTERGGANLLY